MIQVLIHFGYMIFMKLMTEIFLFDWGDTLMVDFPGVPGKMCDWDKVEAGEILFEVITDKVSLEVEAYSSGILLKIVKEEGQDPKPSASATSQWRSTWGSGRNLLRDSI